MLTNIKVLDCTDGGGHLAGMLLAQLGAEVVLAEAPEGTASRRSFPSVDGEGLRHQAFNRGKTSTVVDGIELQTLARSADVVLWSGNPADLPFDPAHRAPSTVLVTISPFGLRGPKAHWPATDLTLGAAAGVLHITGDPDRAPLRISVPQAWHHAALDAAVGALLALAEREHSGLGQHAEITVQRSFLQATFGSPLNDPWERNLVARGGHGLTVGPLAMRFGYPTADGEVSITNLYGPTFAPHIARLFELIHSEGGCSEELRGTPFAELFLLFITEQLDPTLLDRLAKAVENWTMRRTGAEIDVVARQHNVLVQSVSTLAHVLELEHLRVREVWQTGVDGRRLPGDIAKMSATPMASLSPAPPLGSSPMPDWSPRQPTTNERATTARTRPLDGLTVLDLTWSYAGPMIGQTLARAGARVIKVESSRRLDPVRTVGFKTMADIPDHSVNFHNVNAMKESILLDITTEAGRDVLLDLAERADVVIDSFTAGVMDRLGLGHEALCARNPSIISLASSLTGQSGPLATYPGYGNLAAALYGFAAVTSWPDRPVAAPYLAYTDVVSSRFALAALLGALAHRRETGQGQHIDLSQGECSLTLLADALLAEQHAVAFPLGNDDAEMFPHGVFACTGEDRWVAVACVDDVAWCALADLIGLAHLSNMTIEQRRARRSEIDAALTAWSAVRSPAEAEAALIDAGIAAHRVSDAHDVFTDPQLGALGHFVTVDRFGDLDAVIEAARITLSDTPMLTTARAPMIGEHNYDILTGLLGYDVERFAELAVSGVLE